MSLKAVKKEGYYAGYKQGLAGKPYNPAVDLVASIATDTHLKTYLEHYDKGYQQARADQELILRGRDRASHERKNISRDR